MLRSTHAFQKAVCSTVFNFVKLAAEVNVWSGKVADHQRGFWPALLRSFKTVFHAPLGRYPCELGTKSVLVLRNLNEVTIIWVYSKY